MPAPQGRDLELTGKQLREWLGQKLPEATDLALENLRGPDATGFSNDTLMFDLRYREAGVRQNLGLVARIEPSGHRVFPEYDLSRQFAVMQLLAPSAVPVPRMCWEEADLCVLGAPFYVMERVEGRIPTDNPPYHVGGWVTEIAPAEREALWWSALDALCEIHTLDWRALGFEFLAMPELGATPLEQQLRYYENYLEWAARGRPQPTAEAALAWLHANRPAGEPTTLVWGDARIGNMIFRESRCVAVLDWEMVTLGNPIEDLGWWIFLDRHHSEGLESPRLAGFPSHEETVARYEAHTGFKAQDLAYYQVFAGFRFAVIMIRLAQGMVEYGVMPADSDFETNNIVTRLLARILELPPPGAGG